jgi:hypothetical protein
MMITGVSVRMRSFEASTGTWTVYEHSASTAAGSASGLYSPSRARSVKYTSCFPYLRFRFTSTDATPTSTDTGFTMSVNTAPLATCSASATITASPSATLAPLSYTYMDAAASGSLLVGQSTGVALTPNPSYVAGMNNSLLIDSGSGSRGVQFVLRWLSTPNSNDALRVYDGSTSAGRLMATLYGTYSASSNIRYNSCGRYLLLVFVSGSSVPVTGGFQAALNSVPAVSCSATSTASASVSSSLTPLSYAYLDTVAAMSTVDVRSVSGIALTSAYGYTRVPGQSLTLYLDSGSDAAGAVS